MRLKKLTAAVLAGTMVLALTACGKDAPTQSGGGTPGTEKTNEADGGGEQQNEPAVAGVLTPNSDPVNTNTSDETLRIGLSSEPSTLWGASEGKAENEEQIINAALLDRLVNVDPVTKEVLPNLATDWEWVDETHCKFILRDDVTMSDGTPLVAEDVVYTVGIWTERCATNDTGKFIVGAEAEDEKTVTIEFTVAAPDLLAMMAWGNFGIVSEDEVNAAGGLDAVGKNPAVGSGKYRFKEWKSGQSVTLERNDSYWNPDYKGYFKEIVFTFTSDAAAREMAIESGDSDLTIDVPISQAATYAQSSAVSTYIYSFGQVIHLWYNMGENAKATKDQKVRAAIDKALNFDAVTQVATAGFGTPAMAYMDPAATYYKENYTAEERAVDIEGAKALLAEAGYENGLEITALGLADLTPVLTVMQANLAEAGITLNIDTPDTAQFVEGAFGGSYDIICVGDDLTVRTPTIVPFCTKLNVDGPGMVIGGPKWTTDELDAAIAALISESDTSKLEEQGLAIGNMLKEQTVCSNLYSEMKAVITAKDLKGYCTRERGYIDVTTLYR